MNGTEEEAMVYYNGETNNEAIKGVTYDKDTNTLVLNNVNTNKVLVAMGVSNFRIELIGENYIPIIYTDCLTIIGDGSLILDVSKSTIDLPRNIGAINLITEEKNISPKLIVEKTATVNLKAQDYVIAIFNTPNNDWSKEIVLENGQNLSSRIEKHIISNPAYINALCISSSENPESYNVYMKDDKMYGLFVEYGGKHVLKPIIYVKTLDGYLFDPTVSANENVYNSEEEIIADGYVKAEADVTIDLSTFSCRKA